MSNFVFSFGHAVSLAAVALVIAVGCTANPEVSRKLAEEHVTVLAVTASKDVEEVREGLPQGVEHLRNLWKDDADPKADPEAARDALTTARSKTQALRVVKSTFFAVATKDGTIVRNDQDQDLMAGADLFSAFPALKKALAGKYLETVGSMHEARGVEGKPDGQWVAAQPIEVDGSVRGLYVTGWAWSLYTYRLETALKSHVYDADKPDKSLSYVFVVVGDKAYGTRVSPLVNAEAIEKLNPMSHLDEQGNFGAVLEITGRSFGLAVKKVPALGANVAVAVLRSET